MNTANLCLGCMEEKGEGIACPRCGYDQTSGPESSHHLPPGTILQEKYLVGKVLGQGGFGITYLAWDITLDLKLAIKEYFPFGLVSRSTNQPKMELPTGERKEQYAYGLKRYLEEARTLARFIEHHNVVSVRDYFEANNTAYLAMSYHEGVTLQNYLVNKGGKIPVEQALAIFMPVLDALKEVHAAGILHRDISPDNILISSRGRVVLIDFGAARQAVGEQSRSLSVIMKAGFSPEEQYHSKGRQGPWTDIYAVAASIYCAITGTTPPESLSRLSEDTLVPPTDMGVKIESILEQALLKALAVRAKDRYQTVEDFQEALIESGYAVKEQPKAVKKSEPGIEEKKATDKRQASPKATPAIKAVKEDQTSFLTSKKTLQYAALVVISGLLIFGAISLFGGGEDTAAPAVITGLNVDYYIDYENGTIPIGDLPIGARVVDPSWEWEFRTGDSYTRETSDETKPVTWIIVAKNHYSGLDPHVTLLSEELIGNFWFDNSTDRGSDYIDNHWGKSGTTNASCGLRPWLNSIGIHENEGFYRAFSESFRKTVLMTSVPNREWENGNSYSSEDYIFVPSTTELGDSELNWTYRIGEVYSYFVGSGDVERIARLGMEKDRWYWTRSPCSSKAYSVRCVSFGGGFFSFCPWETSAPDNRGIAVRPALNLKSDTLVSEIRK